MNVKKKFRDAAEGSHQDRASAEHTLTDADITTSRVDRRSFLAKAMVAGSLGVGAAMTTACPSGSESSDSDSDSE